MKIHELMDVNSLLKSYTELRKKRDELKVRRDELEKMMDAISEENREVSTELRDISGAINKLPAEDIKLELYKTYSHIPMERIDKVWSKVYQFNNSDTMSEQVELFNGFMELIMDL